MSRLLPAIVAFLLGIARVSGQNQVVEFALSSAQVEFDLASPLASSSALVPVQSAVAEYIAESLQIELADPNNTDIPEVLYQLVQLEYKAQLDDASSRRLEAVVRVVATGTATYLGKYDAEAQERLTTWTKKALEHADAASIILQRLRTYQLLEDAMNLRVGVSGRTAEPPTAPANKSRTTGLIVGLVLVSIAIVVVIALLVHRKRGNLSPLDGAFPHPADATSPKAESEVLPGRGADHAVAQNDAWLAENRPDLLDSIQRSQTSDLNESASSESGRWWGRILGSPTKESLASQDEEQHAAMSWWGKLVQQQEADVAAANASLPCDEDAKNYDFAFSDFPRTDGTPCLIYSETDGLPTLAKADDAGDIENLQQGPPRPNVLSEESRSTSLTNDDFRKQLSMHSLDSSHENDSVEMVADSASVVSSNSKEFTQTLGRLVELRHRHYERNEMVARHKSRDEQLRRHEMEIDLAEIEASAAPKKKEAPVPKKHRSTVSAIDVFSQLQKQGGELPPTHGGRSSGPSMRVDDTDSVGPKKLPPRAPVTPRRKGAHRRSSSHGTNQPSPSRNTGTTNEVMTLGLAAYSKFS